MVTLNIGHWPDSAKVENDYSQDKMCGIGSLEPLRAQNPIFLALPRI